MKMERDRNTVHKIAERLPRPLREREQGRGKEVLLKRQVELEGWVCFSKMYHPPSQPNVLTSIQTLALPQTLTKPLAKRIKRATFSSTIFLVH